MMDDFGPKLLALPSDAMRTFVLAYVQNGGNAVQAATTAGYGGPRTAGWRILQRKDIQDALEELMAGELKALTPATFGAMKALVEDPNHKDHAKAVLAVLDRTGFHAKSEHKTTVEHQVADTDLAAAILKIASELGWKELDHIGKKMLPKPPVIVEAEVVDPDLAELMS